ncbi:MAG: hypothetical protein KAH24_09665 [Holophagae bacterium]|nr:hypothetical protein [Holophagae bacterium]
MEEANWLATIFAHPFAKGLGIGLFFCLIILVKGYLNRRDLRKEIANLHSQLHTKLEIDSEENERRKQELETLKQERDNLRITVQSLNQKPGRKEIRQYYLYQTALDIMFEKAPGFAPAWQITLKEAESLFEKSEKEGIPILKRLMPSNADKQVDEYEKLSRDSLEDGLAKQEDS